MHKTMKKNITINLFGSLYAIDEDAYELLKQYEDSLRAYFSTQEGGDEIADDLERRVAELFEELKANGTEAISIENVQEIISRIGKPEQLNEEEGAGEEKTEKQKTAQTTTGATTSQKKKKKLFRDPTDKMLGGVMSGLANYLGGNVLVWRILITLLCIFTSFTFLIIYIAMWIIIPEATTPEDFLRMEGKDVTPDNIAQSVLDMQQNESQPQPQPTGFSSFINFLLTILKVVIFCIGIVFTFVCLIMLIAFIVVCIAAIVGFVTEGIGFLRIFNFDTDILSQAPYYTSYFFWGLLISGIVFFGIPVYCCIHHFMQMRQKTEPMSAMQRTLWIVTWFVTLAIGIASAVLLGTTIEKVENNRLHSWRADNEIVYEERQSAWDNYYESIPKDSTTAHLTYIREEHDVRSFSDEHLAPSLQPGIYTLKVKALADMKGAYIYVNVDGESTYALVSYGTPGKVQKVEKAEAEMNVGIAHAHIQGTTTYEHLQQLPECSIDSVVIRKPVDVHYGISTKKNQIFKTFHGQRLMYINNFELERIGDLKISDNQ